MSVLQLVTFPFSSAVPRSKTPFQEVSLCTEHCSVCHVLYTMCVPTLSKAIVFVVGGGNYIEYLNLQDYARVCSHTQRSTHLKR